VGALLAACILSAGGGLAVAQVAAIPPIDPQKIQDQDAMTWNDYKPIPGVNWTDPTRKPTTRALKIALIAIDFEDQPFVIIQQKGKEPFGNPQIDPIKREDVARFYTDFWHKPSALNHGQTIHGYWMEQSRGRYGVDKIDAYGPYKMPRPLWFYGLNEHRQNNSTPDGSVASGRMEPHCDALWREEPGATNTSARALVRDGGEYDLILRIYAGYDETGVWQEFGEMKFETQNDIPPEWGNPDPTKPRWVPTRYVPWTSWLAGMQQWGVASIRQGENSGTIMHEIAHTFFSVGDNNNNPYVTPYRRVGSGTWDMMDRGSFNGPGGPHTRWVVPVQQGGSMPAGLMLRQRLNFGFLSPDGAQIVRRNRGGAQQELPMPASVLFLSREGLAKTGLAVAKVTARAVDPLPGEYAGIVVRLDGDPIQVTLPAGATGRGRGGARGGRGEGGGAAGAGGGRGEGAADGPAATGSAVAQAGTAPASNVLTTQDRTPWEDPATNPLSQGIPNFNNYSLEVVQRIGYDSFCPDSGVLLAKNKDAESSNGGPNAFNCFNWVIDAHPEDIRVIDYKKPKSGEPVYRTLADFRQLNDALFHAGTGSGSQYEWQDPHNKLHFYVVDMHKNPQGILSYTLAVRSLDGGGSAPRGVALEGGARQADSSYTFTLRNTGQAASVDPKLHPQNNMTTADTDVYRLTASVDGAGWSAQLPNALAAVKAGASQPVKAFALPGAGAAATATLRVTAVSESDPSKTITATVQVTR
jgi:M6 family metalloprotease-like protein